jgi:multiple sugar transport system substrate-binding protein
MFRKSKAAVDVATLFCAVALGFLTAACTCAPARPVLKVLTFRDRQSSALRSVLPEFEKTSGVRVQFDDIPAGTVATKMMTDLAAGGTYDIYAVDEPFIPQFQEHLLPLSQWPDPLSAAELSLFEPKALEAATVGSALIGLPVNGNVYQYIYRKDLFESELEKLKFKERFKRELRPPATLEEMIQIAQFFHRPPKLYGFAPFTKMSEGTTVEYLWLMAASGSLLSTQTRSVTLTDIQSALQNYSELLKTAPASARSWHHTERMSAYSKGKIAQMMTWNSFFFDLEDEHKSLMVGRTGYSKSPGTSATGLAGTWIAGVRKGSSQLATASAFIRWWTSRPINEALVLKGLSSARSDILTHPTLSQTFPWLKSTHINFENAFLRPRHKNYRATSDEISLAFTRWIAGQSPDNDSALALQTALNRLKSLSLDQTARTEAR